MDPISALGICALSLAVGAMVYAAGAENKRHRQIRAWDE